MKLRNLFGLMVAGTLVLASCKKDDNGGGGNNSTPTVASLNCASAIISDQPVALSVYGGTATVPYTGGNGASYANGSGITSTGVSGLTATLVGDVLASGNGNAVFSISGTPSGAGVASFAISLGGQSCTLNLTVNAPAPYIGKWNYQYMRDSIYNWDAYRADPNQPFVYDSTRVIDYTTSTGYFQFNGNNTYTWQTAGATAYSGSFTSATSNYAYGVTLKCLGISTQPAPNDTTRLYIYTLNTPNMTLNRDLFIALNANNDTLIIDRYYDLLKQ